MKRMLPLLLTILLCIAAFTVIAGAEESETYLSDLKPAKASVGWGELHLDEGLDGNKLLIGGEYYEKGICAHAPSELEYDVTAGYVQFVADIGLHNGSNNGSKDAASVKFIVEADGEVLYESGVFKMDTPAEHIEVMLPAGAQLLTLRTTDASDGNSGDHSSWGNAKLIAGEIDLSALKTMELTLPDEDLTVGGSAQILPTLTDFGGNEIPLSKAKITYTSTDPAAMSVDKSGKVTCKAPGSTVVNVSATVGDITIEKSATLRGCGSGEGYSGCLDFEDVFVSYSLDQYGALHFSVKDSAGNEVVPDATVGIVTKECDFSDGLTFVSETAGSIDETYENISGKHSVVSNQATVKTLVFEKAAYRFTVEFRAYGDGFAYRYTITRKDGKPQTLNVTSESGWYSIPEENEVTAIVIGSLGSTFNHEAGYTTKKMSSIKSGYYAFPVLLKQGDDRWMLLSEAELYGDVFVGSVLHGIGDGKLQMQFAPKTTKSTVVPVELSNDGFTSPWRFGIIGSLAEVVESEMTEKLCERTTEDFSWVEPGVTAWMWLSEGFNGQRDKKTVYEYIDLAADMGWKYLILDEGWQPNTSKAGKRYDGYYSWFDDMIKYAADRGVGIIAWVLCNDLDTPEEREVLQEWADKGIKGIKVDFFDSEDQDHIGYYQAIYEACAKAGLIVNCHGANKPTGERMMWPNIINREAVNGEEYGGYGAKDLCTWPFIRNVVGPMDLTPRMNPSSWSQTTTASQMAMNVVFECGIPCMASAANEYLSSPAKSFYKDLPAAWDDTKLLSGDPGKFVVMARRSGDNWYMGGISAGKRKVEVNFDFLEAGASYMAFVYKDNAGDRYNITVDRLAAKKGDSLSFDMFLGSGFSIKFIKVNESNDIESINAVKNVYTVMTECTVPLDYQTGIENAGDFLAWHSKNPAVATVNENGVVTGVCPGEAEIVASFVGDPEVKATFKVTVTAGEKRRSGVWNVYRETIVNRGTACPDRENGLVLTTVTGDICGSVNNVWNVAAPEGDFEVIVTVLGRFAEGEQSAGLLLFSESEPGKTVAIARRYSDGNCIDFYSFNSDYSHHKTDDRKVGNPLYVKLERKGDQFYGYYSYDQKSWKMLGNTKLKALTDSKDLRIGVYAGSGTAGAIKTATLTDFTLNGAVIPFFVKGDAPILASAEPCDPLSVTVGTAFEKLTLPGTVVVSFTDGSKGAVPVVWEKGDFAADDAGKSYTLVGSISGAENPSGITASLTVTVTEAEKEPTEPETPERKIGPWIAVGCAAVALIGAGIAVAVTVSKKKKKKQ